MAETVIDRGGSIAADTLPSSQPDTAVARSGGWGNLAMIGAGVALVGAIGGIAIGYGAFHHTETAKTEAQPAKASEHTVDEVLGTPDAQRTALAGELGRPNAPKVDIFGRPIAAGPGPATDASAPSAVGTTGAAGAPANGQMSAQQHRMAEARARADAARRSPIMAFGNNTDASGAGMATGQTMQGQSLVRQQTVDASGFGPADGDEPARQQSKGPSDFSAQLRHSTIETVRASIIPDRNLLLSAGTVIPCTLQTAINSTQAGFISCVINHDVFSENGRIVLLDKGTKVLGQYSGGISQGQARLFVVWTRALTPRGVAIDLGSPASDSLGRSGLPGGVDTQFWARFGTALMMSVLEDASSIAGRAVAGQGTYTTQVPSNTAQTILQDTMSIKPILKKNQGDTAAIFVAKDFDFRPVYDVKLRR